jgi:hypothetical protein
MKTYEGIHVQLLSILNKALYVSERSASFSCRFFPVERALGRWQKFCCTSRTVRAGTHYPHVTWSHVMLRVQLGGERRFNIECHGADSHFCHSAYVTWSHVEFWSAHAPARLSHFCCRTHFVRRDQRVECRAPYNSMLNRLSHPNCTRNITWAHMTWG